MTIQKKILIADDEPDVLAILEKKLKANGFDVLALSKGKEIIAKVKSFRPRPFDLGHSYAGYGRIRGGHHFKRR